MKQMSQKDYFQNGASQQPKEYTVKELSAQYGIPFNTIQQWIYRGYIQAEKRYVKESNVYKHFIPETEIPTFMRIDQRWRLNKELRVGGDRIGKGQK